jgi:hypothetical protein
MAEGYQSVLKATGESRAKKRVEECQAPTKRVSVRGKVTFVAPGD